MNEVGAIAGIIFIALLFLVDLVMMKTLSQEEKVKVLYEEEYAARRQTPWVCGYFLRRWGSDGEIVITWK